MILQRAGEGAMISATTESDQYLRNHKEVQEEQEELEDD